MKPAHMPENIVDNSLRSKQLRVVEMLELEVLSKGAPNTRWTPLEVAVWSATRALRRVCIEGAGSVAVEAYGHGWG